MKSREQAIQDTIESFQRGSCTFGEAARKNYATLSATERADTSYEQFKQMVFDTMVTQTPIDGQDTNDA